MQPAPANMLLRMCAPLQRRCLCGAIQAGRRYSMCARSAQCRHGSLAGCAAACIICWLGSLACFRFSIGVPFGRHASSCCSLVFALAASSMACPDPQPLLLNSVLRTMQAWSLCCCARLALDHAW